MREAGAVFTNREWYTKACEGGIYHRALYRPGERTVLYHLLYVSVIVILIVIVVGSVGSGIIIVKYNKSRCNGWFASIKNVSEMVPELAKGNLDIEFNDDSDIEEISVLNNSLNTTVVQLRHYIEDISSVVSAVAECNLTISPKNDYKGDFISIRTGLVEILDKLN